MDVRMYEVGLGAAILLEFDRPDGLVRVIADGGDRRHSRDFVQRLRRDLAACQRIDLMIGTHYDADHLDGLAAVLETDIEVTEVWLPPVAYDGDHLARFQELTPEHSLYANFAGSRGHDGLDRYLMAKAEDLGRLISIEDYLMGAADVLRPEPDADEFRGAVDPALFFEEVERSLEILGPAECGHACDIGLDSDAMTPDWYQHRRAEGRRIGAYYRSQLRRWISPRLEWLRAGGLLEDVRVEFARLRLGVAKQAITAVSLQRVVDAVSNRPSTKVRCVVIEAGEPVGFGWDPTIGHFVTSREAEVGGIRLTVLGPSRQLVQKHRDALPVSVAFAFALESHDRVKPVSASNQLSYVIRFDAAGQGILVTGDAPFVDFGQRRGRTTAYHARLVAAMKGLAVIQVPHHGGINGHFYRVMKAAGYHLVRDQTFLLLSHEGRSSRRPSGQFADYMLNLGSSHPAKVLFTNEPAVANVADYRAMVHEPVTSGCGSRDVLLRYDGVAWRVLNHPVRLPSPEAA